MRPKTAGRKVHTESDTHHTLSHFHIATVWFVRDDNVRKATLLAWLSMVATALRLWCSER